MPDRQRHHSHRRPGVPTGLQVEETPCGQEDAGWVRCFSFPWQPSLFARAQVGVAFITLCYETHVGISAGVCLHKSRKKDSGHDVLIPNSGQSFAWHAVTRWKKNKHTANALSCFSLRNLHHVLSEDLHVCSWGDGATWGGWVMLDTLSNVKTWVNIIVWAFLKMFTFTKVWFDSKRKKNKTLPRQAGSA